MAHWQSLVAANILGPHNLKGAPMSKVVVPLDHPCTLKVPDHNALVPYGLQFSSVMNSTHESHAQVRRSRNFLESNQNKKSFFLLHNMESTQLIHITYQTPSTPHHCAS
jgi:hypothetical protein